MQGSSQGTLCQADPHPAPCCWQEPQPAQQRSCPMAWIQGALHQVDPHGWYTLVLAGCTATSKEHLVNAADNGEAGQLQLAQLAHKRGTQQRVLGRVQQPGLNAVLADPPAAAKARDWPQRMSASRPDQKVYQVCCASSSGHLSHVFAPLNLDCACEEASGQPLHGAARPLDLGQHARRPAYPQLAAASAHRTLAGQMGARHRQPLCLYFQAGSHNQGFKYSQG